MEAVHKSYFMKIDQQPDRNIQKFHITQQLRFMHWKYFFNGLEFDQQTVFNKNITSKSFFKNQTFVFYTMDASLLLKLNFVSFVTFC